MWQRFMDRVLAETKVTQRFTEHDVRAKRASDAETLEHARALLSHADARTTNTIYRRKPERVRPLAATDDPSDPSANRQEQGLNSSAAPGCRAAGLPGCRASFTDVHAADAKRQQKLRVVGHPPCKASHRVTASSAGADKPLGTKPRRAWRRCFDVRFMAIRSAPPKYERERRWRACHKGRFRMCARPLMNGI